MSDQNTPRRSRRLALRRRAQEAVNVPKPLQKAIVAAGTAIDKMAAASKTSKQNTTPPSSPSFSGLNAKQAMFVQHYLLTKNATLAAKKAGYSKRSAHVTGWRLLQNPIISAAISKKIERVLERLDFTSDSAIEELANQARSNMQDYFKVGEHGQPVLDWSNLTRAQAGALQELTVEEFVDGRSDKRKVRRVKFKLADKQGAIDLWAKYKGVYVEKHQHQHTHTLVGTLLDEIDQAGRGAKLIEQLPQVKPD